MESTQQVLEFIPTAMQDMLELGIPLLIARLIMTGIAHLQHVKVMKPTHK